MAEVMVHADSQTEKKINISQKKICGKYFGIPWVSRVDAVSQNRRLPVLPRP